MGMAPDRADKFIAALEAHECNSAESMRHLNESAWTEYGASEQVRIVCLALLAHIE